MYVTQIRKRGWYIDAIVSSLHELPIRYIPFITTVGVIDDVGVRGVIIGIQKSRTSNLRGRVSLLPHGNGGEGVGATAKELLVGEDHGLVWTSVPYVGDEYWNVLRERGESGLGDFMAPRERNGEGGGRDNHNGGRDGGSDGRHDEQYDRVVKLDVDVSTEYYDVKRLVEDKVKMLRALGYQEEKVEMRPSPSGKHLHILITLTQDVPLEELFYLQFALGDDPKRAEFNFFRLAHFPRHAKRFNVLFLRKEKLTRREKMKVVISGILKKITR